MPKSLNSTLVAHGMRRPRPVTGSPIWSSGKSAELRTTIDRLRGRGIHCSRLALHAHSAKIAAEFEQLARDYEDDAVLVESQLWRKRHAVS